jgi:hypothetical protein
VNEDAYHEALGRDIREAVALNADDLALGRAISTAIQRGIQDAMRRHDEDLFERLTRA